MQSRYSFYKLLSLDDFFGLLDFFSLGSQQSADGQRDTLVLSVHIGDLHLDLLALSQNVLGLADALVSDLGDVDQAINAGQDLCEGAEGHQLDDLGIHNITDLELGHELVPGVHLSGLVVDAKIVKLMTFGAFAEIIPGVDGLIHISQIANKRIGKPGDVLAEGQEVQVKITDVDAENKRIYLSIRALLDPVEEEAEEAAEEVTEEA